MVMTDVRGITNYKIPIRDTRFDAGKVCQLDVQLVLFPNLFGNHPIMWVNLNPFS